MSGGKRRIPVNAITIPYWLHAFSTTWSSRTEPPGCATVFHAPLLSWPCQYCPQRGRRRRIPGPRLSVVNPARLSFSSAVNHREAFTLKVFSHLPSASTSMYHLPYTHQWHCPCPAALLMLSTKEGSLPGEPGTNADCPPCCLARRVQCTLDCCPAPIPMACPPFTPSIRNLDWCVFQG